MSENENDDEPDFEELDRLLEDLGFADAYYNYCDRFPRRGPEVPLKTQQDLLAETGRVFKYDKREKFYAWRDSSAPEGCDLGLNLVLERAQVEWILVFRTPSGHLGSPFSAIAASVKRLQDPAYRHAPPNPTPDVSNKAELANAIEEGLALYDRIAGAIVEKSWK